MRLKPSVLFAVLLLGATGACGEDADTASTVDDTDASGEQLTKEEFLVKGDAICGELEVATSLVEFPQSQEEFAAYLTGIRGPAEAARERWELLEPPTDGEDVHQAQLDSLTSRLEALNGAITAAESGDTVTAEDLRAEADRAGDVVVRQAQAYGFEECGKDGADGDGSPESLPEEEDLQPNDPQRDDEPPAEDQPGDPKP